MSEEIKFALFTAVMMGTPSIVSWFVLKRVRVKSKKWANKKRTFWGVFCWSYFVLQVLMTILCLAEGLQSKGTEDVPIWGMEVVTVWGFAFSIAPFLSLIIAAGNRALQKNGQKADSTPAELPTETPAPPSHE